MADQLHYSIRDFRDILLAELTKLEFGAREHLANQQAVAQVRSTASASASALAQAQTNDSDVRMIEHERENKKLRKEIAELNEKLALSQKSTIVDELESSIEILNRQIKKLQQENIVLQNSKNDVGLAEKDDIIEQLKNASGIFEEQLRQSMKENDRLKKDYEKLKAECDTKDKKLAIMEEEYATLKLAAVEPKADTKNTVAEAEAEEEEGIDPESLPDFKHKGKTYKKDADGTLYIETEEGWENAGTWDEASKSILTEEVEAEAEAEEEAEEEDSGLTEFLYKGKTYFLDGENNVYQETDEGYEQVGKWNGKKVLLE